MKTDVNALRNIIGNIAIKKISLDDGKSLHDIHVNQNDKAVIHLLNSVNANSQTYVSGYKPDEIDPIIIPPSENTKSLIETIYDGKLQFKTNLNNYYILGLLTQDLSSLQVTLIIEEQSTGRRERTKIDLYEREQVRYLSQQISEIFYIEQEQIETELLKLTDELEIYREQQIQLTNYDYQKKRHHQIISPEKEKKITQFLSSPNLLENIDKLIEQAGVVGEENTRKLLFVVASTYKMSFPLHSLIQGISGSGKSHLINTIGQCFPPEDVISMTRVTSKSFYYFTRGELVDKLILIQDYDGLDEEAQYAFRELQSSGIVSSSTTFKDHTGNISSTMKTVKSHFASLLATTKADIYYDNMSRSVVIGVDESEEQTIRIIDHQNNTLAGLNDPAEERKAKEFLQNCMRCLKSYEVVNPFADKVKLPSEAKMLRRLNQHYQIFIKQITLLHQYQRKRDHLNRLISEPEDLQIACEILFDAIMVKVDDLDSSLRQFFNKIKDWVKQNATGKLEDFQFTQREIRLVLNASKTTCFRYFEDLELLEYIQKTGGYANRGFKYKIVYWDDMEKIRTKIKQELTDQLSQLNVPVVPVGSNIVEH
jgi:hypothetical protein